MDCMAALASSHGQGLPFDRSNPSTWGDFETWNELCGAMTAVMTLGPQPDLLCMMCGTEKYPIIHSQCDDNTRKLAGTSWQLFDAVKEDPNGLRRLQQMTKSDSKGEDRKLQTCPVADIPYPTTQETFYDIIVGPLLLPIVLDVTGVDITDIDFGDDDELQTGDVPSNPNEINTGLTAILSNFQSRTNQVSSMLSLFRCFEWHISIPILSSFVMVEPCCVCIGSRKSTRASLPTRGEYLPDHPIRSLLCWLCV